eukprot:CAMPEP_0198315580 /NCGR_PEP_ID=MMETSP1450-20131203/5803_1 /TAXON_ID=753684 ORGANISM="Madagascaria erythrocladiodes, Strain CCMP3234" /NCGR_SAMPLE_ID=MMETSP1450 /ASSEMBLY_ACC=CAM_ASM_001115 /LENGTH=157 /DNA_ID=CAMNT_0044018701 /DNA_START=124 /DNA_END=593 /DNA_ORIENTATION=+
MSETALISDPTKDFELKKLLGRGSFGSVYYALRRPNMDEVAVKRLEVSEQKQMDSVLREIDIMKGVENPHIVRYYNNYYWKKEIWISMEFCVRESDHQILTNRGFLFLDEVEALVERDARTGRVRCWHGLRVANYCPHRQQLVYDTPCALVVHDARR